MMKHKYYCQENLHLYFNNVSSLSNVALYSTGFTNVVVNSQIPSSSVSAIKSSVSVAVNSNALWNK
ncbi:hypothetical protein FACS189437_08200 [Bacteroidia bacterium]|nr:hypothetical protein FACS189437_08200 [Bacteroidia bacterium]